MMRCALTIVLAAAPMAGLAQNVNDMYPDRALRANAERFESRLTFLLDHGLRDFMDGAEKRALDGVRLHLPLKGEHPLDVYSVASAGSPMVVFPILSLAFIEDLSTAYAWRFVHGHSLEPMDEYLAMLKYRPSAFGGGRVPDPLAALGVPPDVLDANARVNDLSLRLRNTAWAFVLAHELGHLRFRHPGNRAVDPALSRRHEEEADRFAVDVLSRSDTIPMGMVLWFQASVAYFRNRADFDGDAEYIEWTRRESTHPVNADRLRRLGASLSRAADAALDREAADTLRFIGVRLVAIGDILADPEMQRLIARCAMLTEPADLTRLHDRPCGEQPDAARPQEPFDSPR